MLKFSSLSSFLPILFFSISALSNPNILCESIKVEGQWYGSAHSWIVTKSDGTTAILSIGMILWHTIDGKGEAVCSSPSPEQNDFFDQKHHILHREPGPGEMYGENCSISPELPHETKQSKSLEILPGAFSGVQGENMKLYSYTLTNLEKELAEADIDKFPAAAIALCQRLLPDTIFVNSRYILSDNFNRKIFPLRR